MFFKKKKKVCLIGLDGVPYTLLKRFTEDGTMPNIAALLKKGDLKKTSVTIPEISSVSWSSFMTGENSATHGIYGFMDVRDKNRQLYFPNYTNLHGETIWHALEKKGKKSAIVNLPSTYPASKMNGILVSGFVALELEKSVYPLNLISKLQALDYRIDIRSQAAKDNPDFLFKDLEETTKARFAAFDLINKEIDWDFFMPVVTGTDRLHHFLWSAICDSSHPYYNNFISFYNNLDARLAKLISSLPSSTEIMLISDHGFTEIITEVYLNKWLEENGYLSYSKSDPMTVNDIDPKSRAFALDPSRIYINKKSRFDTGSVNEENVAPLVSEISSKLSGLEFNGTKIIKRIYRPEELYKGDEFDKAPDIILLSNYGYDLKGRAGTGSIFAKTHFTGMHTQDDALLFSTAGLTDKESTIFNVKNYILNLI